MLFSDPGCLIVGHAWRSPRVRRNPFPRFPPDLPMSHPSGYRVSLSIARLPCNHRPYIRFLFVGSEFCLRLPPDLASRQRPCLQLTVPTTTACSGLAPYRFMPCLAHKKQAVSLGTLPVNIVCSSITDGYSNSLLLNLLPSQSCMTNQSATQQKHGCRIQE
jgi:hypothetical protein